MHWAPACKRVKMIVLRHLLYIIGGETSTPEAGICGRAGHLQGEGAVHRPQNVLQLTPLLQLAQGYLTILPGSLLALSVGVASCRAAASPVHDPCLGYEVQYNSILNCNLLCRISGTIQLGCDVKAQLRGACQKSMVPPRVAQSILGLVEHKRLYMIVPSLQVIEQSEVLSAGGSSQYVRGLKAFIAGHVARALSDRSPGMRWLSHLCSPSHAVDRDWPLLQPISWVVQLSLSSAKHC